MYSALKNCYFQNFNNHICWGKNLQVDICQIFQQNLKFNMKTLKEHKERSLWVQQSKPRP